MKLTWYGHSCFMMESRAGRVVFDPYADGSVPGLTLPRLTADLVLCSHGHADHAGEDKVTLTGEQTDYTVETLCCWHDDAGGTKRGENLIRIVSGGGARVCHLGDVGHMLSKGQIKYDRRCRGARTGRRHRRAARNTHALPGRGLRL